MCKIACMFREAMRRPPTADYVIRVPTVLLHSHSVAHEIHAFSPPPARNELDHGIHALWMNCASCEGMLYVCVKLYGKLYACVCVAGGLHSCVVVRVWTCVFSFCPQSVCAIILHLTFALTRPHVDTRLCLCVCVCVSSPGRCARAHAPCARAFTRALIFSGRLLPPAMSAAFMM